MKLNTDENGKASGYENGLSLSAQASVRSSGGCPTKPRGISSNDYYFMFYLLYRISLESSTEHRCTEHRPARFWSALNRNDDERDVCVAKRRKWHRSASLDTLELAPWARFFFAFASQNSSQKISGNIITIVPDGVPKSPGLVEPHEVAENTKKRESQMVSIVSFCRFNEIEVASLS